MQSVTAEFTLNFYTQLLVSLGLAVEGPHVVMLTEDGAKDVTVDERSIVLPTRELLNKPNWAAQIAFNPLCENTLRGESEIQRELVIMVKYAVNIRLMALIWRLLKLAGAADAASKAGKDNGLKPAQAEFLSHFPGFDKTMQTNFGKLLQALDPDVYNTSLIHLNLKRRYQLGDKKWERVCLVRFPFMDVGRKEKPWSSLRVKDYDALCSIMEFILPDWTTENAYSAGTDQKVAPYFATLVTAYHQINSRIREVALPFADDFPEFESVIYEDPWFEHMDKFSAMRETLPVLDGNEGALPKGPSDGSDAPAISEPVAARAVQVPLPQSGQGQQGPLPWEDAAPAQTAPRTAPAPRKVDEDTVEYVPRQPTPVPTPQWPQGHPPQAQAPQIPLGYGAPVKQETQMTFHELAQLKAQQRAGYAVTAAPTQPPVGGSPFAGGGAPVYAQPTQQPVQQGGYQVAYTTPVTMPGTSGPGF